MLVSEFKTRVRQRLAEPRAGRFFENSELIVWLNDELKELSQKLEFLKKKASVLGSTYVTDLGTDVLFYEAPGDMIKIDFNRGILCNGIRRLPTSQFSVDAYQERQLSNNVSANYTIYPEDYFAADYSGIVFHYTLDYIFPDEIDDSRSGKLIWFLPNPVAADVIDYYYIMRHPAVTDDDNDIIYIDSQFEELIVLGAAIRGALKMLVAGFVSTQLVQMLQNEYKMKFADAKKHYSNDGKKDRKSNTLKTAKARYGMYSSGQRRPLYSDSYYEV